MEKKRWHCPEIKTVMKISQTDFNMPFKMQTSTSPPKDPFE